MITPGVLFFVAFIGLFTSYYAVNQVVNMLANAEEGDSHDEVQAFFSFKFRQMLTNLCNSRCYQWYF